MPDDAILLSHARDLLRTAVNDGYMTHTAFLDLRQRSLLQPLSREAGRDVKLFFYGGYDDAQRTLALFLPAYLEQESIDAHFAAQPDENPLALLRLEKDPFSVLSHRDYLGALMGLGVKRELLGDILVDETGAFLFCLQTARRFLSENLTSAGRATLTVRPASLQELKVREPRFEDRFASVASLRLDAVLGAAFSLSRADAAEAIERGAVFLNAAQIFKPDARVSEGDKLILRGKGKVMLLKQCGQSKKGRAHIRLRRYL